MPHYLANTAHREVDEGQGCGFLSTIVNGLFVEFWLDVWLGRVQTATCSSRDSEVSWDCANIEKT